MFLTFFYFVFFKKTSKKQNAPGINYGLSLSLGPLIKTNQYSTGLGIPPYGLKVLITNYTFAASFFETFLSIGPGQESNIIVERTIASNAPKPYSLCTDLTNGYNSATFNWMIKNNKTYRQESCFFYRQVKA